MKFEPKGENPYAIIGDTAFIGMVNKDNIIRYFAMIDAEDLEKVRPWRWSFDGSYAVNWISGYKVYLHQLIMGTILANKKIEVDHIDRNKLNNRKKNLRIVTHKQNIQNSRLSKNNTSGYNGVWWNKRDKCWATEIRGKNSKKIHLGSFKRLEDAIAARKQAEIDYGHLIQE